MNIFLERMTSEGNLSLKRLKQLYRIVSKRLHPDLANTTSEEFIKMSADFREAELFLGKAMRPEKRSLDSRSARTELLKRLFDFSIKVFTSKADALLAQMIAVAGDYDPSVGKTLAAYGSELYGKRHEWMNDPTLYYSHGIFIVCIKQLFRYYTTRKAMHRTLFKNYRQAMEGWSRTVEREKRAILLDLYEWLERELDGEPIEYLG